MRAIYSDINSNDQIALQLAHDIASPLTVMQFNIRFIKDLLPEKNLSMMQTAINQIREITHSVLNKKNIVSRINLVTVVEKIILEKKFVWKDRPCDIEFITPDKKTELIICAGTTDIYRMLSNLFNNAYESLGEKRKIVVRIDQSKNHLVLSIVDSGCGIPENKINSVLHGESLKENGHGIGLNSAFSYMQTIGGHLVLRSTEAEGTEIQLVFPKTAEAAVSAHPQNKMTPR